MLNPTGGGWFKGELKLLGLFLGLISFANLVITHNTSALFTPTLSASVDQANLQVNGNQVINSTGQTTEIPLSLTVNTNNKTGYTVFLNSETAENALINTDSGTNAKIDSISALSPLNNFSNNTWGVKFGNNSNFSPIPKLIAPANVAQTAIKTNGNETTDVKLGMKLGNNLESGSYKNKLIFSILTNRYDSIAKMTTGPDFNTKLKSLETTIDKIDYFKKSTTAPVSTMNVINVEDGDSDYEIKIWLDHTDKTAYYYTEPEKVYLNEDSMLMFYGDRYGGDSLDGIKELNLSNFDTSKVMNMSGMFSNLPSLTSLDLFNFDTSKVTNMDNMFYGMRKLSSINLSSFDTSKVTDMVRMFSGMSNLTSLNLSNFNTSKVTSMESMFYSMSSLTTLDLSNFNTSKVTSMESMFSGMSNLTSLNLSNFNTSKVTSMESMFSSISSLTTLDLFSFDTSKVTDMVRMFYGMRSLTSLNLSNFDTSKVTHMSEMFSGTYSLTSLNLSSFDTSKVTDMRSMFSTMFSLTTLNLSSFDTSKVTNMESMFAGTYRLTTLNLSSFNTSKVTNMNSMFLNMSNLTSLDLSNFNTSNVTDMSNIFYLPHYNSSKDKLETIYIKNDFDTTKLTSSNGMFTNRKKLRGGNGSYLSDPSTADKSWLRIDDPAHGRPGYFTRKP